MLITPLQLRLPNFVQRPMSLKGKKTSHSFRSDVTPGNLSFLYFQFIEILRLQIT